MRLHHTRIVGRVLDIEPLCDKNFPRHHAFICERIGGKRDPIYMALQANQDAAIAYARKHGFNVPVGF